MELMEEEGKGFLFTTPTSPQQDDALRSSDREDRRCFEELRESEEKFRTMANMAKDAIVLVNGDAKLVYMNPVAESTLGFAKEEICGKDCLFALLEEKRESYRRRLANFGQTGRDELIGKTIEIELQRKDGTHFLAEISVSGLNIGGQRHILGILRDITERKQAERELAQYRERLEVLVERRTTELARSNRQLQQEVAERRRAEEALRESERSLWGIIEGAADGVLIVGCDGRVEFCNRVTRELVGCRSNKPCHCRLADLMPEEFRCLGEEASIELKETGAFRGELPLISASGSLLVTEANAITLADGRSFLSFRDISQRKKTDAELMKAKEAAEAANRAKSQFLANVSHEMRTPMNGILGFASALEKTRLTENQREAVEMVILSANHLLCIINDLLDLAKIEAGKMDLVEEPVILEQFLGEICDFFKPLAAAKDLMLTMETAGDGVAVVIMDPARVRQILINLIGNALKFTQRGGIHIRVNLQREENLERDKRRISFDVTDTGIGIPAGKLEAIFDSFHQVFDDVSPSYGGTGLGLTITRRLVGMLGGEIQVESTPGKGTTFRLNWITRVDEGVPDSGSRTRTALLGIPNLKGKTILAVDDNPINLRLVVYFLRPTQARILTAEDSKEALALMRKHLPDLVLMDMRMPHMDGYEATRQAKSEPAIAAIPIIAVTASAMKEDRNRILEAGCDEYLAKPITRETLFDTLQHFLLPSHSNEVMPSEASRKEPESSETGNEWLHPIAQAVTNEYAPQLNELLSRNDLVGLSRFGHTMKGLGRQFQLESLAKWGESFEKSAETLAPDVLREQAAQFDAIAREITALCGNGQDERAPEGEVAQSLDKESNNS